MLNYKLYFFLGLTLIANKLTAQQIGADTILHLNEVIIKEGRLSEFSTGTKVEKIDTSYLKIQNGGNLADLLSETSPLFIKTYGLGSLATSSFRGGSAYHTAVLWNGFNLNSPANGQLDLALIPDILANKFSIQYGGSSALWGSGAIGGSILIDNDLIFNRGLLVEFGSKIGSFGHFSKDFNLNYSDNKLVSTIKLYHVNADNDFEFYDPSKQGNPKRKQVHADYKRYGLITEHAFRINNSQNINIRFWYQNADRNIPPIILQNNSSSNQKDESYRLSSEWQLLNKTINYIVRLAYFDEYLDYNDDNIIESGKSSSQSIIGEFEVKKELSKRFVLNLGFNNTYINGQAAFYDNNIKENRSAIFLSITNHGEKLNTTISFRQEYLASQFAPLAFSLGSEFNPVFWLSIKGSISRVYRLPTFNERFWVPGGNKELLSETGYTEDLSFLIKPKTINNNLRILCDISIFNRNIDNWILWLPGSGYWSPINLSKVWSRGFETNTSVNYRLKNIKLKASILTSFTKSTNEFVKIEGDASLHKQLIYVPEYSGSGNISIEYRGIQLIYSQIYTGYRYTSTDNEAFLPPYWLSNISALFEVKTGSFRFTLTGRINNIFNESYQVLLNRPMPLNNYQLGVQIGFHKNNSSN